MCIPSAVGPSPLPVRGCSVGDKGVGVNKAVGRTGASITAASDLRLRGETRVPMCDSDTTHLQASPRRTPDVGASRARAGALIERLPRRHSAGCQLSPSRVPQALGDRMPPEHNTIRPFEVSFPEAELAELRRRVNATRWPDRETVADDSQGERLATMQELVRHWGGGYAWTRWPDREPGGDDPQGVRLATMQELVRHWGAGYDWTTCEENLNGLPQFTTEIEGLDIHFLHPRSHP